MSADINSLWLHRDSGGWVVTSGVGCRLRLGVSRRGPTLLGSRRSLRGLAVRMRLSHLEKGRSGQRVPFVINIRSVFIGIEPPAHGAGQSVHLDVGLLQQISGTFSDAVKLGELNSGVPAEHRLKSSLGGSPTSRVNQNVDPARDNPQKLPSLLRGGIRGLALVRIFLDLGHGRAAGGLLQLL